MNDASVTIDDSRPRPIVKRLLDEVLDVLGDALVRVVGGVALELHAVMRGAVEPFAEIVLVSHCRQRICSHWFR